MNFVAMRYNRLSTLFMIIRLVKWLCIFFKEVFAWSKSPPIDDTRRRFVLFFMLLQLGEFLFKNFFILFEKPNQNGFWVFPVRESEAKATILSFVYNRKKWLLFCLFIILSVIQRAVYIYTESDGSYNCFAGNGAHSSMCIGTTAQYRMVPLIKLQFHDKIKVIKGVFWHLMCFNEKGQLWFFA